jgi:hypothetical protein
MCGLFNSAIISSHCIVLNGKVIGELWIGKSVEANGCGVI